MSSRTILMIAPFPPLPDGGGGIVIFSDLYELKQRGVCVDLICFRGGRTPERIKSLEPVCRHLIVVEGPPPWSPKTMLNALLQQQPMVVARHHSSPMELAIREQLAIRPYDVVLVEFNFMVQYVMQSDLSFAAERPLLAVEHHVVTPKVYEYFSRVERNPLLKLFRRYEIPRLKSYLRDTLTIGDQHLFLGQEDLDYVRSEIAGAAETDKLVYRPTGLMLERYPVADITQAEPYTIGFFASFDWEANIDAALYFTEDILPLIRLKLPQVKFVLAGRFAPPQIRDLGSFPFIEFLGEVEDMFLVAQRVSVIVVPLRIGAGTRLKILEAMAWGKAIVTTSTGVEGVESVSGKELVVADTPESFAQATLALLNNPEQQRHLAQAGRRRIETTYTTQQSVDRLQEALKMTLN